MDLVAAVLVTLLIGLPIAWWLTSPRRRARRAVQRWERAGAETAALLGAAVLQAHPVRLLPEPRPPVVLRRNADGRTCVVGAGERATVSAAPAPTTSFRAGAAS